MSNYHCIGNKIIRKDGREKATGDLLYMADIRQEDMLYASLVHPPYAHAKINAIDTAEAESFPGVVKVITARDIPGTNVHGLIFKDQPVICDKEVKYLGDTVAIVLATTQETAVNAVGLVKVDYTRLTELFTYEEAMQDDAPVIHEGGNLAAQYEYKNGDLWQALEKADVIVEQSFQTGYQEHAYLETEGGIAKPLDNGGVEIWLGCQNAKRVGRDLATILKLPEDKIIVHSYPLGGGFGGKDDLVLQGMMCVCALACGKPIYLNLSREESFLVSPKRMPMEIDIRMAARSDGTLLANEVRIKGTAGAYASYSPAIMSLAMEHACGMYYFPSVDISSSLAYTNNCSVGAFRGFGNAQINFAVESMMNMLAEKLNMDPIQFRRRNVLKAGMKNSYGYRISDSVQADSVLEELAKTSLWSGREEFKKAAATPWLKRGVGFAGCFQGVGLGNHCIPDHSTGWLELLEDGSFLVSVGNEDMGQGSNTTLAMMAAEVLKVSMDRIEIVCGINNKTPESGATTASKTTYITGSAIIRAAYKLLEAVAAVLGCEVSSLELADNKVNCLSWNEIYLRLSKEERKQEGFAEFDQVQEKYCFGVHYVYTYLSQIVGVEVNTLTGETKVLKTEMIPAAGTVINRLGFEGQCDGGAVMSLGFALIEDFRAGENGELLTKNFQRYLLPTMADMPEINVIPVEEPEKTGPFGANGIGEPVAVTGAAAIMNAVQDAVGLRITKLPCSREKVLMSLKQSIK